MQESELTLQRLAGGLRELTATKSDLAQYDSALLEQQLEQLHGRWEELCTKVSAPPWGNHRERGSNGGKEREKRGKWREGVRGEGQRGRERGDKLLPVVPWR